MWQWTSAKETNYCFQAFAMVCFTASKTYAANLNWNLMRPGGFKCNRMCQGSLGEGAG